MVVFQRQKIPILFVVRTIPRVTYLQVNKMSCCVSFQVVRRDDRIVVVRAATRESVLPPPRSDSGPSSNGAISVATIDRSRSSDVFRLIDRVSVVFAAARPTEDIGVPSIGGGASPHAAARLPHSAQ